MDFFVAPESIVRRIWGKGDTILFIFAGAAAEFALNKAVDWLYFTGKLPADPLGRLFSTVLYARQIVFSEKPVAEATIARIRSIHGGVEQARGYAIPDWAYRDVLFMLIHYSMASYELLERRLSQAEKEDLYEVFHRMGLQLGLKDLPRSFSDWEEARTAHLASDLEKSQYTVDLFRQYHKHLGWFRYRLLLGSQRLVVPGRVKVLMQWGWWQWVRPIVALYKLARLVGMDRLMKSLVLPRTYRQQVFALDQDSGPEINGKK